MTMCSFKKCFSLLHPKRVVLTCADCEDEVECCVACAAKNDLCQPCKHSAEVAWAQLAIQTIVGEVNERGFTFALHNMKRKDPQMWAEHHRHIVVKDFEVDLTFSQLYEMCFYGILDTHVGDLIAREFVTEIKEPDLVEKFDLWAPTGFDKAELKKLLAKNKHDWHGRCTLTFYVQDTKERLQKLVDTNGWGLSMIDHALPVNSGRIELVFNGERCEGISPSGKISDSVIFGLMGEMNRFNGGNNQNATVFASWTR